MNNMIGKITKKGNRKKLTVISSILLILILIIFFLSIGPSSAELVFFNVGQGDAALLRTADDKIVLFDGGPDNLILQGLGKYLPFYQRKIDYIIVSHYHDDHFIGFIEVIKRYQVKKLVYSGKEPDSQSFLDLLKIAGTYNIEMIKVEDRIMIELSLGCSINIINPAIIGIKNDPNNSITAKIACGGKKVLLAGDSGDFVEKALLAVDWLEDVDIFKASHHGSNTSNSLEFLKFINPELIVISVGTDNRYGHPGKLFLERVSLLNIPIKRTDKDGSIKVLLK